ncbi:ABC transporter substrate-binding protein [Deinococcota bacterium DY0809b]
MKTRTAWIAWLLPLLLLGGCRKASAEREVRVVVSGPGRLARAQAFAERLRSYGLDGVRVRVCDAGGEAARLAGCLGGSVALYVTVGGVETRTAVEGGGDVPVLYVGLAASLDWGFVERLSRPGGRVTGVDNNYAELSGKRLQLLQLALPEVRRVLVLYQPGVVPTARGLVSVRGAAEGLGLELAYRPVSAASDLVGLEAQVVETGADAVLLLPSYVLENHLGEVLARTNAAGVPLVGLDADQVRAGAFLAYGADGAAMGRQAARMARQLFLGYPIAEMPVERPQRMTLTIHRGVARRLGLEPDPRTLDLADEVLP